MLALVGCAPTPEATCDRLEALAAKDASHMQLSHARCIARMREMKERDPDAYRCAARTVAKLTSLETALLAVSVCDPTSGD